MKLLVSVVNKESFLYIVDLEKDETTSVPIHADFIDNSITLRPKCRPFGISWDQNYFYIANNKRLHRFDKSLKYIDTPILNLAANSHQITYKDGFIYLASPWANAIVKINTIDFSQNYFDLIKNEWAVASDAAQRIDDLMHVNSVLIVENKLYVNAHNFGSSYIIVYDLKTFKKIEEIKSGLTSHNIAIDDRIYFLNTGKRTFENFTFNENVFLRGFGMTKTHWFIGASPWDKTNRYGESEIVIINRADGFKKTVKISGDISDLRVLDEFDFSHQNSIIP